MKSSTSSRWKSQWRDRNLSFAPTSPSLWPGLDGAFEAWSSLARAPGGYWVHGREAFRREGDAFRGSSVAGRARPVRRRHHSAGNSQRLLRAQPSRPRQGPLDRCFGRADDARCPCRADCDRPAGTDANLAHPDDPAGSRQPDDAHATLSCTRRGELRGAGHRRSHRGQSAPRRGRRRDGGDRLRGAAGRERRARGGRAGGAADAHRHSEQCGAGGVYSIRRRRRCLRPRDACVRGGNLGAPRRRHGDGGAGGAGELRASDRYADRVVGNADPSPWTPHAGRLA